MVLDDGSMGRVASSVANTMIESLWSPVLSALPGP
jgi:hypothetical protein